MLWAFCGHKQTKAVYRGQRHHKVLDIVSRSLDQWEASVIMGPLSLNNGFWDCLWVPTWIACNHCDGVFSSQDQTRPERWVYWHWHQVHPRRSHFYTRSRLRLTEYLSLSIECVKQPLHLRNMVRFDLYLYLIGLRYSLSHSFELNASVVSIE